MRRLFIPINFIMMCLFSFVSLTHAAKDNIPTVEFNSALHFLTPAGEDVQVGPGAYEVEATES
ncbi:MAG: hypothetical protein ACQ9IQ_14310 [Nitrospirales bacterium]